jgi:hypothetical protein
MLMANCTNCGAPVDGGRRFCVTCGAPVGALPAPVSAPAVVKFDNPFLALTMVGGICLIFGWALWTPLGLPAQLLGKVVTPGSCAGVRLGSFDMYVCSAKVALQVLIGPLAVMVLLVLFRKSLAGALQKLTPNIPPEFHFLLAPLVATLCFTMSWAAVHAQTAAGMGLLPQQWFPCAIGLFTFAVARFGGQIQDRFRPFFDVVQGIPKFLRIIAALLIPLGIGLVITLQERVSQTALKEQTVVLLSMACGYVALSARQTARRAPQGAPARGGRL